MNTDEIQVAPGSCFLARNPHSKKRSEWFCYLLQFTRSQRQGGHGRHGPSRGERGPHGRGEGPRSTGGGPLGRNPEGPPGPVSSASDFGQNPAGFPGPIPADILGDFSWALAVLQSVQDSLLGPADTSLSSECTGRACLLEELSASNRECSLSSDNFFIDKFHFEYLCRPWRHLR